MIDAPRKIGPLDDNHWLVADNHGSCNGCGAESGEVCLACRKPFETGDFVTLVGIGPGDDPETRKLAREGRPYNVVAIPAHWACVTGEE